MNVCMLSHFSHVRLFVTLWAVAHQAPLSTGFSRQEYWSRLSFPSPGDLPNPGIEPVSVWYRQIKLFQLGISEDGKELLQGRAGIKKKLRYLKSPRFVKF